MKVGFIGLGNMGAPMARNLVAADFSVAVFDRDDARIRPFRECGVNVAASAEALATTVDVLMTSLPGPQQSRTAMPALIDLLSPGSLWIDLTTNDRSLVKELAADAAGRDVDALECPVTGAVDGARKGKLTLFVGGKEEVLARAEPLLAPLGTVIYCGPIGTGTVVKLLTNQIWFINAAAIGEALTLGVKGGVPPLTIWEALKKSVGDSFVCRHDVPSIFAGHYDPSFTLDLCCKDLDLLKDLSEEMATHIPMTLAARSRFQEARQQFGGAAAELLVCKLLEDHAHVSLRVDGDWPVHSEA
jgi:3-hydroxyisobutyrate dehydrogenase